MTLSESASTGKTEYLCAHLDANEWDSLKTKTALSTFRGAALLIRDNRLALVVPQGKQTPAIAASAEVQAVTLDFPVLNRVQNTCLLVDFGAQTKWMVNFANVWNRKRILKPNGQVNRAKALFFPVLWNFKSIGVGKKLRQEFIDVAVANGARLAAPHLPHG